MDKQKKSEPKPINPKESLQEIARKIVDKKIEQMKIRAKKEPNFQVRF